MSDMHYSDPVFEIVDEDNERFVPVSSIIVPVDSNEDEDAEVLREV